MATAVIILAAGQGSRMKSDLPKVLHKVAGAPLLIHAMKRAELLAAERTIVVTGHGGALVEKQARAFDPQTIVVTQHQQRGTGHAVDQARQVLSDFRGDVIVLYGDTPFITEETLEKILAARRAGDAVIALGFMAKTPGGYGRLVLAKDGKLEAIVEAKDASPEELKIEFCNSGVICAESNLLFDLISELDDNNANGEVYLTDVISHARARNLTCSTVSCPESETMGVNSRADLARAELTFQHNARASALASGVTLTAPETVWFAFDTEIGRDVTIEPNVVFGPGVTVESGAEIKGFCHLEGCHISQDAVVGPYARLRPGAEIGDGARVGNFVEIKEARVGEGAKVNHLSYIGDASIGTQANIGAGTITCNYDGVFKHHTDIGARAFIGSNTALVAPVRVGDDAMTGSGSVITKDIPDKDLAIARARQENKSGLALRLKNKLKAAKAALQRE